MSATLLASAASSAGTYSKPSFCFVINHMYPVYTGGGLQALALATEFRRLGHNVFFVSQRYEGLPEHARVQDIDVYRVQYDNVPSFPQVLRQVAGLARVLLRLRNRYDVVQREIEDSKTQLEACLGQPIRHFSYPNSGRLYPHVDDAVESYVRQAGFRSAVTSVDSGMSEAANVFRIGRLGVNRARSEPGDFSFWLERNRIFTIWRPRGYPSVSKVSATR